MLLPTELRVLSYQLSKVPVAQLPCLLPNLSQNILCCKDILSGINSNIDDSAISVLLNKLKIQLTTLLNGKQSEGRFAAIVLIKAYVDVGGLNTLKCCGSWVRGLLSVLGKPDPFITKELCLITLTKLFISTHHCQTLIREISTPTIPVYITSCLNLLAQEPPCKTSVPNSLREAIFRSFALILPLYSSVFRPFASQIRCISYPYLVPTVSKAQYVSSFLKDSAQQLFIRLLETSPKNTCGHEWTEAVKNLVRQIHITGDQVFRAIIEDWEPSTSYGGELFDINKQPHSGDTPGYFVLGTGVEDGADYLIGLLEFLTSFFKFETFGPISVPIGTIMNLINRILSISIPSESESREGFMRLNHCIEKEEQDFLWCCMPKIYTAVIQLILAIEERIGDLFLSKALESFDHLTWVFPHGKKNIEFRVATFNLMTRLLLIAGKGLQKPQVDRALSIIKSCCEELISDEIYLAKLDKNETGIVSNFNQAKSFNLIKSFGRKLNIPSQFDSDTENSYVITAASRLLSLFVSCIPQHFFDMAIRSMIERTAILSKNKEAMLACVLNPFIGPYEKEMTSILPHLTRAFASEEVVEILLRPRMPLISMSNMGLYCEDGSISNLYDSVDSRKRALHFPPSSSETGIPVLLQPSQLEPSNHTEIPHTNSPISISLNADIHSINNKYLAANSAIATSSSSIATESRDMAHSEGQHDDNISLSESMSGNESVHLTMELDTDSE